MSRTPAGLRSEAASCRLGMGLACAGAIVAPVRSWKADFSFMDRVTAAQAAGGASGERWRSAPERQFVDSRVSSRAEREDKVVERVPPVWRRGEVK